MIIPDSLSIDPKPAGATIASLLLQIIVLVLLLAPAHAADGQAVNPAATQNSGTIDDRIEKLRSAYTLFPLNEIIKHDLAETYAGYGFTLFKKRQYEQADEYFIKALELYPDDTNYTLLRGICTYLLKKYDVARHELGRLLVLKPDSVDGLYYLGLAMYESDSRLQAVELWEQALKLAPARSDIAELLTKSRKEIAVEAAMDRGHSSRFNLTYDPDVSTTTALAILDVLESASNQIGAELGHFPEARVPVAIYKRSDYSAVTASPDWSGGGYDGTIRLPFGSVSEITPPLRAILFHEYAHVVVFDLTRGNCPLWLNEGIAEIFGRNQFNHRAGGQKQGSAKGTAADFRRLEGSFSGLSSNQALSAYQQSFSMVSYIVATYGWHRVKEILANLGNGMNIDAAIAGALKDYSVTYNGLIREWQGAGQ